MIRAPRLANRDYRTIRNALRLDIEESLDELREFPDPARRVKLSRRLDELCIALAKVVVSLPEGSR